MRSNQRKVYTTEFKLVLIQKSKDKALGGVTKVARDAGVSAATLSVWRQMEHRYLAEAGRTVDGPHETPPLNRRYLTIREEKELAAWYRDFPGKLTRKEVVEKVRETHPTFFIAAGTDDERSVCKKADDWLYCFRKRNKLTHKGRGSAAFFAQPTHEM